VSVSLKVSVSCVNTPSTVVPLYRSTGQRQQVMTRWFFSVLRHYGTRVVIGRVAGFANATPRQATVLRDYGTGGGALPHERNEPVAHSSFWQPHDIRIRAADVVNEQLAVFIDVIRTGSVERTRAREVFANRLFR